MKKFNHTPQTQSSIGDLLQQSGNMHAEDSIQAVEDGIAMFFAPKKHTWNGETASDEIKVQTSRKLNEDPGSSGRSCHDISEPQSNLFEAYKKHSLALGYIVLNPTNLHLSDCVSSSVPPPTYTAATHHDVAGNRPIEHTHGFKLETFGIASCVAVVVFGTKWSTTPLELGLEVDLPLEKKKTSKSNMTEICLSGSEKNFIEVDCLKCFIKMFVASVSYIYFFCSSSWSRSEHSIRFRSVSGNVLWKA